MVAHFLLTWSPVPGVPAGGRFVEYLEDEGTLTCEMRFKAVLPFTFSGQMRAKEWG